RFPQQREHERTCVRTCPSKAASSLRPEACPPSRPPVTPPHRTGSGGGDTQIGSVLEHHHGGMESGDVLVGCGSVVVDSLPLAASVPNNHRKGRAGVDLDLVHLAGRVGVLEGGGSGELDFGVENV